MIITSIMLWLLLVIFTWCYLKENSRRIELEIIVRRQEHAISEYVKLMQRERALKCQVKEVSEDPEMIRSMLKDGNEYMGRKRND